MLSASDGDFRREQQRRHILKRCSLVLPVTYDIRRGIKEIEREEKRKQPLERSYSMQQIVHH
jgi:hypothetical protein